MAAKPILLACYDFPPNKGIGGRRWAKFAKGLVSRGYLIHVIKAHPVSSSKNSGWTEDISEGIVVHSLPRSYPKVVSEGPKTLIDKFKYRWEINRLQRREKGTIYDIASGWKDSFLEKASEVIHKRQAHWEQQVPSSGRQGTLRLLGLNRDMLKVQLKFLTE